ncbi:hypothetical protein [uncultured Campylobacter sp.]|uniref:hypothetical protein n=1 Tax=uncultured Campylobacter sp. TaxID=218934 RepID=UPI00261255DA|nr:hypothetical protein [uncultured Campylobacter sp.]
MAEKAKAVFYFIIVFYKIQYNQHIGLASGTISGIETDENGNITGFDPQKFALGFLVTGIPTKKKLNTLKKVKLILIARYFI